VVEPHRTKVHDQVHARAHRAGPADTKDHDLTISTCCLHRSWKCRRVIEITSGTVGSSCRPIYAKRACKLFATRPSPLAVEHCHRLRRLMLSYHHIVCRGGSMTREGGELYGSLSCGGLPPNHASRPLYDLHDLGTLPTERLQRLHALDNRQRPLLRHWLLLKVQDGKGCRNARYERHRRTPGPRVILPPTSDALMCESPRVGHWLCFIFRVSRERQSTTDTERERERAECAVTYSTIDTTNLERSPLPESLPFARPFAPRSHASV
jgi:hypothetical protein